MSDHTQNLIWNWVHHNEWWWTVMQIFAAFIALRIFRLAPAFTLWGRAIRMVLLAGLILYTMSFWNSGLSVFGFALILLGLWLWVEQLICQCLKAGHIRPIGLLGGWYRWKTSRHQAHNYR